jgi:hypothetical protein
MSTSTPERLLSSHEMGFQDLNTPTRLQVVSGVIFLAGDVKRETIWERVQRFVDDNPQFQCHIVGGKSLEWKVNRAFDISNHLEEVSLSHLSTEEILSFVSNAAAKGLPSGQSPWRIALLRFTGEVDQKEQCAIAIWAHHSLIDGLQGMKLYSSLQDRSARPANSKGPSAASSTDEPGKRTPVISGSCVSAVAGQILRRPLRGPFKSNGFDSKQRTTIALQWTRESFQTARRQYDASFQEVVLAVLTEALAQFSRRHGHQRNLRAILPLGRPESNSSSFTTNRHDIGFIDLPTASTASSRLHQIRKALKSLRREQEHSVFDSILGCMSRLPKAMRRALSHRFARQADLLISLIPGGRSKGKIDGAEVTALFAQPALPPSHAVVVGVTVTRCRVSVAVQVDPAMINCVQELKTCFERAYQQTVTDRANGRGVGTTSPGR